MCVCAGTVLRNGDSHSSSYIRNELKKPPPLPPVHHHPYEHKKKGSRPDYKFREILDRKHKSE